MYFDRDDHEMKDRVFDPTSLVKKIQPAEGDTWWQDADERGYGITFSRLLELLLEIKREPVESLKLGDPEHIKKMLAELFGEHELKDRVFDSTKLVKLIQNSTKLAKKTQAGVGITFSSILELLLEARREPFDSWKLGNSERIKKMLTELIGE
jgi:hypothetical protein